MKTTIKAKWIEMVKSYIMTYPNIPKATNHYQKLLDFAEKNNLDFVVNLDGAIKYLDQNEIGLSFRHSLDSFKMR